MRIDDFWADGDTGEAMRKELHAYLAADATEPPAGSTDTSEAQNAAQERDGQYAGALVEAVIGGERYRAELAEKDREIERLRGDIEMGRTNLAHYREQIDAMAGQVARVRALAGSWEAAATAETGDCPDGSCATCTMGNLSHVLRAALDVPAGPPLHEQTDRDGGNIPSDRERAYAEATHGALIPILRRIWTDHEPYDPQQVIDAIEVLIEQDAARACVEVEKRHTAALRGEVERLRDVETWASATESAVCEQAREIGRVEAMRDHIRSERSRMRLDRGKRERVVAGVLDDVLVGLDAALRSPQPTEEAT